MTWQLHVPHRSRSDSLVDVICAAVTLKGEDGQVACQVALDARLEDGMSTAGELLDRLAGETAEQRRSRLDRARERAGLRSTAAVEAQERLEALQAAGRRRAGADSPLQRCPAEGCTAVPVPSDARRWWCPDHRHLAAEGDLEPRQIRLAIQTTGALVDLDEYEAEAKHAETEAATRRVTLESRLADSAAAAEQMRRDELARRQEVERLVPPGFPR